MKKSKYTLVKEQFPENDYCLLYNTLSKAVALLSTNDLHHIGTEKESLITDLKSLYEQGFLVDQDDDERSKINMYFTSLKCNYFSYATMIYTTYDCNMRCPYCFENGIKENKSYMTSETANDVVTWLMKEIQQYQPKYFSIAFSGGEPLLNLEAVRIIISKISTYCSENGIFFQFGLLTNGTIKISIEDAALFQQYGLRFIQYTIDGDKEVHNKRRVLTDGSYDIIIQNMIDNARIMDIETIIRINIDQDNHQSISHLLEEIKALELPNVTVDFAIRFDTPCDKYNCNSSVANSQSIVKYIKESMQTARELGINHSRRYASDTPCLAVVPRQFVIDPVGDLYKCAAFAGEKKFSVGSIYNDKMTQMYTDMVGHDAWQDCKDCPYVPLCGGGCLFINEVTKGNFKHRNCQHGLFESLVMETLASSFDKSELIEIIRKQQHE